MVNESDTIPFPLSSDQPISSPVQDELRRCGYATSVAKSIITWPGDTSIVLAIYGAWGSGKSSLKNLILAELSEHTISAPYRIEFNPWMWSGQDRLLTAFFDEIASAITMNTDDMPDHKSLAKRWRKYGARLSAGSAGLSILKTTSMLLPVPWLPLILGSLHTAASKAADLSKKAAEAHEASYDDDPTLEALRLELIASLKILDRPILVILDDVDRLSSDEIRLLFQLIKACSNMPKLIFLVLCDRNVVEEALSRESSGQGRNYLEKIVQVGFELPKIKRSDLDRILISGLDKIFQQYVQRDRFSKDRWTDTYITSYKCMFGDVRDVNRFLSSFSFSIGLFAKNGSLEVDPIDLIGIELLRVFEPDTYQVVADEKDFLLGEPTVLGDSLNQKEAREHFEHIATSSSNPNRKHISSLLACLFPKMEGLANGMGFGSDSPSIWARDLRICHPSFFDRYFELDIRPEDIRQSQIDLIIEYSGDRSKLVSLFNKFRIDGHLAKALDHIDDSDGHRIPNAHALPFTTAMFDIGDDLPPENQKGILELSYDVIVRRIVRNVLRRIEEASDREEILLKAIDNTTGLNAPISITWKETIREERKDMPNKCLLSDEQLPIAQRACVKKIELASSTKPLPTHALQVLLAAWKKFGGNDAPRDYVRSQISTLHGTLEFIKGISGYIQSSSGSPSTTKTYKVVRLKDVEEYIDIDSVTKVLKPILEDTKVATEQMNFQEYAPYIEAYNEALDRRARSQSDDPIDDVKDEFGIM
jgi:predicted KAP-like P-loop ATPase